MTKKEKLLDYIAHQKEDEHLYCLQKNITEDEVIHAIYDMDFWSLKDYINENVSNELFLMNEQSSIEIKTYMLMKKEQ